MELLFTLFIAQLGLNLGYLGWWHTRRASRIVGVEAAGVLEEMEDEIGRKRMLVALGEMTAVMAHELRNPLAAAKGHAQLLEEFLEDDRMLRDKARQVVGELVRLERLSNALLDFVNGGRVRLQRVSPLTVVHDVVQRAGDDRLMLHVRDPVVQHYDVDPDAFARALDNIVQNALQVSPTAQEGGEVLFEVFVKQERLYFRISDQGPGLEEGVDIFAPFVTTKAQGTGLGLAIAREIILAHRGGITATHRPDGGAVFELYIPVASHKARPTED